MSISGLASWFAFPLPAAHAAVQEDLELVSMIPDMGEREGPLLVFRDFEADADVEIERHLRLQVGRRKDLQQRLGKRIQSDKPVRLTIDAMEVRLMFVPQLSAGHTEAYQRFCRGITDYFFEMTREDNFYSAITSPKLSYPPTSTGGISAFLVHRLAKAYRATCRFTADSGRSATYKATGAIFSNHLGAVDLEIQMVAPGRFGLSRKPFTIWQNDAETLYSLLSVPIEETLHYYLGRATDRAIASNYTNDPPQDLNTAWRVAEEWMAVEESLVGGLVDRVLRSYCHRHSLETAPFSPGGIPPAAPSLPQYRYRDQGIRLVERFGTQEAMDRYMQNPSGFRAQLLQPQDA